MELEQLFGKDCVTLRKYTDLRMSGMPKVDEFVIGEKTMEKILSLNFECQQCGNCCIYGEKCGYCAEQKTEKFACELHSNPDYSLTCFSFPIRLDEIAIEGIGLKHTQRYNQMTGKVLKPHEKDYIWYELGFVTGAFMLTLYPSDNGFGKGNAPLAKHALNVIEKMYLTKVVPIAPPSAFLRSGIVAVTDGQVSRELFTEKEAGEIMERIKSADFRSFRRMCEQVIKAKG